MYGIDSGTGTTNAGVIGQSTNGNGVLGEGEFGVEGVGTQLGVFGQGTIVGGFFKNNSMTNPSMVIQNVSGGPLLSGLTNGGDVVSIDGAGNVILAGTLTQSGTPLFRTKTPGTDVATYGARTAAPTLEDFGTAQLRNGAAFVSLDRTFASVIDPRNYLVFVAPHGDSSGLYTETSPTGFTVRENKSGRSTLTFDYRIVAKPLDTAAKHLPAMAPSHRPQIRNVITSGSLRGQGAL